MKDFKKPARFAKKSFGARRATDSTERFQATCSECHKICEVPFRPNGKKPVYCRDCFKKHEGAAPRGAHGAFRRDYGAPAPSADFAKQLDQLNAKLDRLIRAVESSARS